MEMEVNSAELGSNLYDDDGRLKRTGTMWTASAHIITAVIGSGVLSLAWAIAQLGWVAGPAVMLLFSLVTYYTSALLSDCYRSGDELTGKRNYTYMDAVNANLSGVKMQICGFLQYANIVGVAIGYTITTSISMLAIKRANCFHKEGPHHGDPCNNMSSTQYMIIFGVAEIFFSQIPLDKISWLPILAAVMSFTYSTIGIGLSVVRVVANGGIKGSITGISIGGEVTPMDKVWRSLQAFGDIAFAYSFANILIEIQDTIKQSPSSSESKAMRRATGVSVAVTAFFYMICGCTGYAAFGDAVPGNLLAGFGFHEPYWLLDVANAAVVVQLVTVYQLSCQPLFAAVEKWAAQRWPESAFITGGLHVNPFRLTWRTVFVCVTTVVAILVQPFFSCVAFLLGAVSFWPLTVYFPVEVYIAQRGVPRWSARWIGLKMLTAGCLAVAVAASVGSVADLIHSAPNVYRPFTGSIPPARVAYFRASRTAAAHT
uniref:Amino acid transporter transmembrane domain-containing protein n=1 Tax=Leersia perrieri TaxID=77586 RepID=A0A0D9WCG3_9ORYZ